MEPVDDSVPAEIELEGRHPSSSNPLFVVDPPPNLATADKAEMKPKVPPLHMHIVTTVGAAAPVKISHSFLLIGTKRHRVGKFCRLTI